MTSDHRQMIWASLEEQKLSGDLSESGRLGTPLELTSAPFRVEPEAIAAAVVIGPRRYMVRLRRIEQGVEQVEARARAAWIALAERHRHDAAGFARAWRAWAAGVDAAALNKLIEAHNRWYPAEANLPMDVRTRRYITFDGHDFRRERIDAGWLLARFPADLAVASRQLPVASCQSPVASCQLPVASDA